MEGAENVLDFVADFNLGTITDKFCWGTMAANVVFKGVHKLAFGFHAFNIANKGFGANKNLGSSLPTINGGCI